MQRNLTQPSVAGRRRPKDSPTRYIGTARHEVHPEGDAFEDPPSLPSEFAQATTEDEAPQVGAVQMPSRPQPILAHGCLVRLSPSRRARPSGRGLQARRPELLSRLLGPPGGILSNRTILWVGEGSSPFSSRCPIARSCLKRSAAVALCTWRGIVGVVRGMVRAAPGLG
jgi:hypothetical protein